jgi:hypothetical protein
MPFRIPRLALIALLACGAVHAADNACLVETKTTFPASMPADLLAELKAQYGDSRECSEGRGLSPAQVKEMCQNLTQAADGLLASMNAKATRKITYRPACPKPFQAACDGASGMPLAAYYYKHSPKDLDAAKKGCAAGGGKWLAGTLE